MKSDYGCLVQPKHVTTDGLSYCLDIVLAQRDETNSLTDFGGQHEPLCCHTCDVTAETQITSLYVSFLRTASNEQMRQDPVRLNFYETWHWVCGGVGVEETS